MIGADLAFARLILSLAFGIGIGMIMALIFRREDILHDKKTDALFAGRGSMRRTAAIFLLVLVALLLSGTLKIGLLTNAYGDVTLPVGGTVGLEQTLTHLVPYDPNRGEEGVTVQGAVLIVLLGLIGVASWYGLDRVTEGFNR